MKCTESVQKRLNGVCHQLSERSFEDLDLAGEKFKNLHASKESQKAKISTILVG